MNLSPTYTRAVSFSRPASRRRIEVFSPKISRRLSLGGYDAYRTWLVIEANPLISTFCERPTFVDGPGGQVVDFWVQLGRERAGEFWMVEGIARQAPDAGVPPPEKFSVLDGLPVRYINRADLLAWSIPIANWARITPYLVSHKRYKDMLLEQSIVAFLNQFEPLDTLLERFAQRDETTVQAALFSLLAEGRVVSPDLATAPLDGATRFCRSSSVMTHSNA